MDQIDITIEEKLDDRICCILMYVHAYCRYIQCLISLNFEMSQIHGYLILCGFVGGHLYSIIGTIISPVLSDQFGFSVKYASYYWIGVGVALFTSGFVL